MGRTVVFSHEEIQVYEAHLQSINPVSLPEVKIEMYLIVLYWYVVQNLQCIFCLAPKIFSFPPECLAIGPALL
jgi:hypothetical protein